MLIVLILVSFVILALLFVLAFVCQEDFRRIVEAPKYRVLDWKDDIEPEKN